MSKRLTNEQITDTYRQELKRVLGINAELLKALQGMLVADPHKTAQVNAEAAIAKALEVENDQTTD